MKDSTFTLHWYLNIDFHLQVESDDYRVFFLNSYSGPARKIVCDVSVNIGSCSNA